MTRFGAVIGIASLVLSGCGAKKDSWKPFTHVETGFTILFPGEPTDTMEAIRTDLGVVDSFVVELSPEGDNITYRVRVDNYPGGILGLLGGPDNLVTARQHRYEYQIEGTTLQEEVAVQGDHTGKAVTFRHKDGTREVSRFFMVDTVMFNASVLVPAGDELRPEVSRFLDSLVLPDDPLASLKESAN